MTNASSSKQLTLTPEQFTKMHAVLSLCDKLGMTAVVLEPKKIRGATADKTAIVVQELSRALYDGGDNSAPMAIARVRTVADRMGLAVKMISQDPENVTATLSIMEAKPYVKTMTVNARRQTFDVRYADPDMIADQVPKAFKGHGITKISLTAADVKSIVESSKAFKSEYVWLRVTPSGLFIELADPAAGEKMTLQLSESEEIDSPIVYRYDAATFIKIAQLVIVDNSPTSKLDAEIYNNGLLKIEVDSPVGTLDVRLLRRGD